MTTATFLNVLEDNGYTDCNGIIQADEYTPGEWIFILEDDGHYTVNRFINEHFEGEPLYETSERDYAIVYVKGYLTSLENNSWVCVLTPNSFEKVL